MSFTNKDLIKKHVIVPAVSIETEAVVELSLSGVAWLAVSGSALKVSSVIVKGLRRLAPLTENLTFVGGTASLANSPVSPSSVTLADNESLVTLYTENIDYTVDYQSGLIFRLNAGALPTGATFTAWYYDYTLFSEGADFEIDYDGGKIRRLSGGAIADGERTFIQFTPLVAGVDESVFSEAAVEANQMVTDVVGVSADFGADLNLQTAATYLGAAIVCRVAGSAALAAGVSGREVSLWLELAQSFSEDARRLLDRFRPARKNLSGPANG